MKFSIVSVHVYDGSEKGSLILAFGLHETYARVLKSSETKKYAL